MIGALNKQILTMSAVFVSGMLLTGSAHAQDGEGRAPCGPDQIEAPEGGCYTCNCNIQNPIMSDCDLFCERRNDSRHGSSDCASAASALVVAQKNVERYCRAN